MAIKVKSADAIAAKWAARAQASTQQFTEGVQNPRRDQAQAAADAAPTWAAGVQAAAANGQYAKGVQKAGSQKWSRNTLAKGAARYPQGVATAQPDMAKGIAGPLAVIAALDLPPRQPKGNPANLQRVAIVANALRAYKTGA